MRRRALRLSNQLHAGPSPVGGAGRCWRASVGTWLPPRPPQIPLQSCAPRGFRLVSCRRDLLVLVPAPPPRGAFVAPGRANACPAPRVAAGGASLGGRMATAGKNTWVQSASERLPSALPFSTLFRIWIPVQPPSPHSPPTHVHHHGRPMASHPGPPACRPPARARGRGRARRGAFVPPPWMPRACERAPRACPTRAAAAAAPCPATSQLPRAPRAPTSAAKSTGRGRRPRAPAPAAPRAPALEAPGPAPPRITARRTRAARGSPSRTRPGRELRAAPRRLTAFHSISRGDPRHTARAGQYSNVIPVRRLDAVSGQSGLAATSAASVCEQPALLPPRGSQPPRRNRFDGAASRERLARTPGVGAAQGQLGAARAFGRAGAAGLLPPAACGLSQLASVHCGHGCSVGRLRAPWRVCTAHSALHSLHCRVGLRGGHPKCVYT